MLLHQLNTHKLKYLSNLSKKNYQSFYKHSDDIMSNRMEK